MKTRQSTMLDTLRAIQQFLDENAEKLGVAVRGGTRRQLDQAVAELAVFAVTQVGKKTAGDAKEAKALRTALTRDHMTLIARIAAVDLPQTPALQDLRMPKGKLPVAKLVSYAHGMAQTAAPYSATFVAAGLSEDFLTQLTAAADAVAAFDSQRKQLKGETVAATNGLRTTLGAASRVVNVIDGMVKSALKNDSTLLSFWTNVKKARKIAVRPATPPEPLAIPGTPVSTAGAS